jgi:hypothetical protein
MPSLFEARCRLPTSANCVTSTCGHEPELSFLAGTVASTTFLFLRVCALSLAEAVTRGEPRCVHPRRPRRRFLLVSQVCPTSIPALMRHHQTVLPPVCSDDRRARVRGPSEGCVCQCTSSSLAIALATGACALKGRMPTNIPLLGALRTSVVAGARAHKRGNSCRRRGPTEARVPPAPREGYRHPANRDALDRHAPSSVHRIAPARGTKTTSRSRRPTRFPQAGER